MSHWFRAAAAFCLLVLAACASPQSGKSSTAGNAAGKTAGLVSMVPFLLPAAPFIFLQEAGASKEREIKWKKAQAEQRANSNPDFNRLVDERVRVSYAEPKVWPEGLNFRTYERLFDGTNQKEETEGPPILIKDRWGMGRVRSLMMNNTPAKREPYFAVVRVKVDMTDKTTEGIYKFWVDDLCADWPSEFPPRSAFPNVNTEPFCLSAVRTDEYVAPYTWKKITETQNLAPFLGNEEVAVLKIDEFVDSRTGAIVAENVWAERWVAGAERSAEFRSAGETNYFSPRRALVRE